MQQNSTGLQHGGNGAVTISSATLDRAALRLVEIGPAAALTSLKDGLRNSHGVNLMPRNIRQPGQPSLRLTSVPSTEAMQFAEMFFAPAPEDLLRKGVAALLGGLRVFTDGSDEDRALITAPFIRLLRRYPADCAMLALASDEARKKGQKVQAEDVAKIAAEIMGERGMIRYALQYAVKHPDEVRWENMTDEERAQERRKVREAMEASKLKEMPGEKPLHERQEMVRDMLKAKPDA